MAVKFGRDTRAIMQQPWYQSAFPETRLSPEKQTETELMTTTRGIRLGTSVGGTLLGRGGNYIIVDDAMKPEEAPSDAKRASATHWFNSTLMSRLNGKENGVVMQRLQVEDLAGYVLDKGNYVHLNLPAVATKEIKIATGYGESYHRQIGEPLHASLASSEALKKIEEEIGSFMFSDPVPPDGALIKWGWFQTYDTEPSRLDTARIVQSWDPAMTPSVTADYSACSTWLVRKNHFYLLDVLRRKLAFPDLKARVIAHQKNWAANTILIENKASRISLIQDLRNMPGLPQPIAINVKDDKINRLAAVSTIIEAGPVFLPHQASWLHDFRSEALQFPNGRHDDQIDSMSQFLNWHRKQQLHSSGGVP